MVKEGRKSKSEAIDDQFNPLKPGFSQKSLSKMVIEQNRLREERRLAALIKVQQRKDEIREQMELEGAEAEVREEISEEDKAVREIKDDGKSAQRMLQDLRFAYRNTVGTDGKKGRARLQALMEADAEFKFFVKELMKIEIALMTAKMRTAEGGQNNGMGQQNFFVVLKGLEDSQTVKSIEDRTVDITQIRGIMDPDRRVYEEEEKSNQAPPDMLLGRTAEATE